MKMIPIAVFLVGLCLCAWLALRHDRRAASAPTVVTSEAKLAPIDAWQGAIKLGAGGDYQPRQPVTGERKKPGEGRD